MSVTISQGTVIGLQHQTRLSNKPYFSYLGIPYAKPPVDNLRFKPPVEHPGWSGELKAFSEGNACMQYPIMSKQICGSEDCLYLNVFVPQEDSNDKKAVMVFIHGGAFNFGSSSVAEFSPDYLLDENVIVVTFNYRLNVLGFLNLDIDECPGNMGLKDQRFAIKWVKENISAFGGNAENITVFGESAGAASVHCHTLSPQSTGLFHRAIMESGCIFNLWAFNENHKEAALNLAKTLGCEKNDPKEIVEYLRTVSALDLVIGSKLKKDETDFLIYPFVPSVECDTISNPLLPAHPATLAKTASPLSIIAGINNMEGIIGIEEKRRKTLDVRTVEGLNDILKGRCSKENLYKIKDFYFNERNLECNMTILENVVNMFSDLFFIKDFYRGFEHLFRLGAVTVPVYNYKFKFDGKINATKNLVLSNSPEIRQSLKGACHADELNYLFYIRLYGDGPEVDSPELKMCKTMSKLWSNFAKTGNPNSPDLNFEWTTTSLDDPKYLSIDGDDTYMVDGLLCESRIKLWETISKTDE